MTHQDGLENRRSGDVTEGSNPSLSADFRGSWADLAPAHSAPFAPCSTIDDGTEVGTAESHKPKQPHYANIPVRRRDNYVGPLNRMSDKEYAALIHECINALDDIPVPPRGLPGVLAGYDEDAFYQIELGARYLRAWIGQAPRSMVNLYREVEEGLFRFYERGRARAFEAALDNAAPAIEPQLEERNESVYFIEPQSGGIKIGMAKDVDRRLRGLQTAHPAKLTLRAVTGGGMEAERAYHKRFAAHRLHGEWFEPHPDILAEIDRLKAKDHPHA